MSNSGGRGGRGVGCGGGGEGGGGGEEVEVEEEEEEEVYYKIVSELREIYSCYMLLVCKVNVDMVYD